ncbi:MAG: carboxypeptidase-like regulatory domain-containing protein [Candidatus Lernaella stagnicola]|nr:carboxypeptidase-like regulatory domain-containing protein [Candidatus Lernaella stagnicola]
MRRLQGLAIASIVVLVQSVCLLTLVFAQSTRTVSGKVIDENGDGVKGAKIDADGCAVNEDISQENGNYTLQLGTDKSPCTFSISAKKEGFLPSEKVLVTVKSKSVAERNLKVLSRQSVQKTVGDLRKAINTGNVEEIMKISKSLVETCNGFGCDAIGEYKNVMDETSKILQKKCKGDIMK